MDNPALALLDESYQRAVDFARSLIHTQEKQQLHVMCLHCTIIEFAHSVIACLRDDAPIGMPILVRSMLEAAIDCRILCREPNFQLELDAYAVKKQLKSLRSVRDDKSEQTEPLRSKPEFAKWLEGAERHEALLAAALGKATQKMRIEDRFIRAGMDVSYFTMYTSLSSAGHNDSLALRTRHIRTENGRSDVLLHRERSLDELYNHLAVAIWQLTGSMVDVHEFFGSKVLDGVRAFSADVRKRMDALAPQPD